MADTLPPQSATSTVTAPATAPSALPGPTVEEQEDVLLACRYGDLDDVRQFVETYGIDALAAVRDDNGNTVLHMTCGNGHEDVLAYILNAGIPGALLGEANGAGSTALHWAAVNEQLGTVRALVEHPGGPGAALIDVRCAAGRTPLGEAERAGWNEGARWLVGVMNIDEAPSAIEGEVEAETEGGDEEDDGVDVGAQTIEVEIEDAEGQVSRMSISRDGDAKVS
ncbi:hypothetical protein M0805_004978 [Coniferiporia weirii]|nr:hypothetical protein M0805_004978 [Coniferiporia weirii]